MPRISFGFFQLFFILSWKCHPTPRFFFDVSKFRLVLRKFLFELLKMNTMNFTHLSNEILELHGGHQIISWSLRRHKLGKLLPLEAYYLRLESYLEYHIPINMWFCSVKCDTLRRWNWGIDWGPAVTSLIHYFNIVLLSFLKKEYISVPELTLVTLVFRGNDSYENNFWVTTVNWRNLGTFY